MKSDTKNSNIPLEFWRIGKVVQRTSLPKSSIYALKNAGKFPGPIRLSAKAVAWSSHQVEQWMQERIEQSKEC